MPPSPVTVTKTGPGARQVWADFQRLKRSEVLVGIPASGAPRKKGPINNAALMYIFSKGSPLQHIPARPWLEPAIKANGNIITPHMAAAAKAMLSKNPASAERELRLAGTVAANAAKRWPMDPRNNWQENAPSTIRRFQKKGKKGKAPFDVVKRPGIDTGQLRRAIISVVREAK